MFFVRKALADDAQGIVGIVQTVVAEQVYSAIVDPWNIEQQREHLLRLSDREAFHVAESEDGKILGFQALELYSPIFRSMSHVGQVGTFMLPSIRGQGVGRALFAS